MAGARAERVVLIGLEAAEADAIAARVGHEVVAHGALPKVRVEDGTLKVEKPSGFGFVRVERVVFHGIFEDDFDTIAGLALWGGPCFPSARGMMDCRLKLPCLVRALEVTRFGGLLRGFASAGATTYADGARVAKWGDWHCGDNKARWAGGGFTPTEAAWTEPFVEGEAVRVVWIGERSWQIRMCGDGWLKSIHHADAAFMAPDPALLADARALMEGFGLELVGVDYMVDGAGVPHLLEVNHIPSVTCFPEIRAAYLERVVGWLGEAEVVHV